MFIGKASPAQAYQRVGLETSLESADPHKLVVLLFEGAMSAIVAARTHMRDQRIAEKGMAISKAIDIILNGLHASLNREAGGELAERLAALYDYMADRLLVANLNNDPAVLDEVHGLLSTLHGAWLEIGEPSRSADASSG